MRHNDKHIKDVMNQLVDDFKLKDKLYEQKLSEFWNTKMGPMFPKYTTRFFVNKKTLFVNISSASLRHELSVQKEGLIARCNEELGEEFLERIVIR